MESSMDDLFNWAVASGAHFSASLLTISSGSRGRGVFASQDIPSSTLLLKLPFALAVRPHSCLKELVSDNKCSALLALILTVLRELFVNPTPSPSFTDLKNSKTPSIPSSWSTKKLADICGTSLLPTPLTVNDVVKTRAAAFETDVLPLLPLLEEHYIPAIHLTLPNFQTALSWVVSRALQGRLNYELNTGNLWPYLGTDGPPTATTRHGENGMFLLPLFDLINHSTDAKERCTTLSVCEDGSGWEMHTHRAVRKGEEILQGYGQHGGAELLRNYGFVERSDLTKVLVTVEQVLEANPGCDAGRVEKMREAGILPIGDLYQLGSEPTTNLITAIQVLVMSEEEYEVWIEVDCIMMGAEYLEEENTSDVVKGLLRLADGMSERIGVGEGLGGLLKDEERRVVRDFKKNCVELAWGGEGGDEGEEDEEEEEEEGDDEEAEQDGKKRKLK